MLSSDAISKFFTRQCPISTLVVDEASQIHVADYISVFYKYVSLRKACFIGDDKQCKYGHAFSLIQERTHLYLVPPFGQDDSSPNALPSIFEFVHLRSHAYFLNTQCK